MTTTAKLLAYIMRIEVSKTNSNIHFASRVDRSGSFKQKLIVFNSNTIENECKKFAIECSQLWNNTDTVPVHVAIDINPQIRKPRGWDNRPRGFIINAPENTIVV